MDRESRLRLRAHGSHQSQTDLLRALRRGIGAAIKDGLESHNPIASAQMTFTRSRIGNRSAFPAVDRMLQRYRTDASVSRKFKQFNARGPDSWAPPCDPGFVASFTIHFVCTGNVYRSRLAEAYCTSKRVSRVRAISSGIAAGMHGKAPISPYAAEVLAQHGFDRYAAARWQRTTHTLVRASDVLVFMEDEHRRFCEKWLDPARQRVEVWGIEDIGSIAADEIPQKVQRTFRIIRQRTDELLTALALARSTP